MAKKDKNEILSEKALHNATEFFELKIDDAMDKRSWDIPVIAMDSKLIDVLAIMCTNDHVWVVESNKNRKVVGVITEHDLLHAIKPMKKHRFFGMPSRKGLGLSLFETAEHIMSHDPFTCNPDCKVEDVLRDMEAHGVRRMPVISPENDEILGEVTVHQLIRKYYNVIKPLCEICNQCAEPSADVKSKKKVNIE